MSHKALLTAATLSILRCSSPRLTAKAPRIKEPTVTAIERFITSLAIGVPHLTTAPGSPN